MRPGPGQQRPLDGATTLIQKSEIQRRNDWQANSMSREKAFKRNACALLYHRELAASTRGLPLPSMASVSFQPCRCPCDRAVASFCTITGVRQSCDPWWCGHLVLQAAVVPFAWFDSSRYGAFGLSPRTAPPCCVAVPCCVQSRVGQFMSRIKKPGSGPAADKPARPATDGHAAAATATAAHKDKDKDKDKSAGHDEASMTLAGEFIAVANGANAVRSTSIYGRWLRQPRRRRCCVQLQLGRAPVTHDQRLGETVRQSPDILSPMRAHEQQDAGRRVVCFEVTLLGGV